jgi:polysaccharide chain length determinant protein (PEP-CTERM system associated)
VGSDYEEALAVLPGQTYTPEDLLRAGLRRKWQIILPLVLGTAVAFGIGRTMPDKYRSETLLMLVPQRIPDNYVRSTITMGIQDRLTALKSQILSRSRLEQIIKDFDLYPNERRDLPMEDIVQRMRADIEPIRAESKETEATTFRIAYVGQDPKTVLKVTERLTALFIEENVRDRENVSRGTNQFLDNQLEDVKRRLIVQEKKLEEYRRTHSGELPSQSTTNLQVIQNAEMQLQALNEAAERDREHRLLVVRQLADLESPDALAAGTDQGPVAAVAQQLEEAKAQLRALEMRLKPTHPDIRLQQRTIRDLEAKLEFETARANEAPRPAAKTKKPDLNELARERRRRDLKTELGDIDRQLGEKRQEEQRLQAVVAQYTARLEAEPKRESELVELTRDYETTRSIYADLLAKREESNIAVNLEKKQIGEQFKVLDPPKEPARPFSPNRPLIYFMGAMAGFAVGLLVVTVYEYRDSSFRSEADIASVLHLPVLAVLPALPPNRGRKLLR